MHFTHVDHLTTILQRGLLSDTDAKAASLVTVEVGNVEIKNRRAARRVDIAPGGVVADYAPFYFAPRSPMLFAIDRGNVTTYQGGCSHIVYLATTLERLHELGLSVLLTDRNAVLEPAAFWDFADGEPDDDFVDWPLMRERYWSSTYEQPDRRERRMAECLVHRFVPPEAFTEIVVKSREIVREAERAVATAGLSMPVSVVGDWYF